MSSLNFTSLSSDLPKYGTQHRWSSPLWRHYRDYYADALGLNADYDGVTHTVGTLTIADYRIAIQTWRPERPQGTVFIAHGYWDHVGMQGRLVQLALSLNVCVVAWDAPGHGLSSGEPAAIDHFSTYDRVLNGVLGADPTLPRPWIACGHSTGGAVLLQYLLASRGKAFQQVVLLAPLVRPTGHRRICVSYALGKHFLTRVKRSNWYSSSHDRQFCDVVRNDPLQVHWASVDWVGAMCTWAQQAPDLKPTAVPVTCLQGTADTTVDWRYNMPLLQAKLSNLSLQLLPDARHHLLNEAPQWRAPVNEAIARTVRATIQRHSAKPMVD